MESGAYTLNNATSGMITANAGAQVYIPSDNEWYKAAYYNAANSSYSRYPNGQESSTAADANYDSSASTAVGAYGASPSSYGTFDQGGNVWEWNDAVIGSWRRLRGGAWDSNVSNVSNLRSPFTYNFFPTLESNNFGFRVAGAVPEPTSVVLMVLASGVMLIRRKR